jgi:hypothetical protein
VWVCFSVVGVLLFPSAWRKNVYKRLTTMEEFFAVRDKEKAKRARRNE